MAQPQQQNENNQTCPVHPFVVELFEKVDKRTEGLPAIQVTLEHILKNLERINDALFDSEKGNLVDRVKRLEEDASRLTKLEAKLIPLEQDHENLVKLQNRIGKIFYGVLIPLLVAAVCGIITFIYNIYMHLLGGR